MSISRCTSCSSPAEKYAELVRDKQDRFDPAHDKTTAAQSAALNFTTSFDIKV